MASENNQLPQGFVVAGRYTIERCIGAGGMGAVYLVHDSFLDGAPIAMKILHPDLVQDDKQTQRFLREVQLMRRVDHPNVVRTFDVGSDGEIVYFTMEYVPSRPLESFVEGQQFPVKLIKSLILQVCSGLQAIHKAGIIHRDMKPANVLVLEDWQVKITDFGVARPEHSELTAHNEIIGSALYIAPEVWIGTKISHSIDLYSFGVVLYEITTGVVPFDGDSPAALMRMHIEFKPSPPKELNSQIPPWLNKLILKMLSKAPEERPRDAQEIIDYVEMQGGSSSQNSIQVGDEFIQNLEESAQKVSKSEKSLRGSQPNINLSQTPQKNDLSFIREIAIRIFCIILAFLFTMGAGIAVEVFRGGMFPSLEPAVKDLSLVPIVGNKIREAGTTFVVLVWLELLLKGSFLFSAVAAVTGRLISTVFWLIGGFFSSALISLLYIIIAGVEIFPRNSNVTLSEINGFSFALSALKNSFGILTLDPALRGIHSLITEQEMIFLPEIVSSLKEAPLMGALQFLVIFLLSLISTSGISKSIIVTIILAASLFLIQRTVLSYETLALFSFPSGIGTLICCLLLTLCALICSTVNKYQAKE